MAAVTVNDFVAAAHNKDIGTVKRGIAQHIDVNACNQYGFAALHYACTVNGGGNEEVVAALVAAKADVNMPFNHAAKFTPLLYAAQCNAGLGVVKQLVEAGADVCAVDQSYGLTALHWISENVDGGGKWPRGDKGKKRIAMADYMLQHGAQPCLTTKNWSGKTPYEYAVVQNQSEYAAFLRDWKPAAATVASTPKPKQPTPTSESKQESVTVLSGELALMKQQLADALNTIQHTKVQAEVDSNALKQQLAGAKQQLMQQTEQWEKRVAELQRQVDHCKQTHQTGAAAASRFTEMKSEDFYFEENDLLGEGQGGRVYRVRYNGADIAVKYVKTDDEKTTETEFLHEISIMQHTPPHPNVVGFLGGSLKKPFVLALTLMRGSLEKLLMEDKEYPLDFVGSATSEAIAKTTLESLKDVVWRTVHCDVAARNMLVDHNKNCCVCDFGMSQILPEGQSSIETSKVNKIPIAWVAPETLEKRVWSTETDVYSFGVMIVELMTRQQPYPGLKLEDVAAGVRDARKPLRPHIAGWWPSDMAELASDCMFHSPRDRPTMKLVNQKLHRYHTRLASAQQLSAVYFPFQTAKSAVSGGVSHDQNAAAVSVYKRVPSSQYYLNC